MNAKELTVVLDVNTSDFEDKLKNVQNIYASLIIAIEELKDSKLTINSEQIKKQDK